MEGALGTTKLGSIWAVTSSHPQFPASSPGRPSRTHRIDDIPRHSVHRSQWPPLVSLHQMPHRHGSSRATTQGASGSCSLRVYTPSLFTISASALHNTENGPIVRRRKRFGSPPPTDSPRLGSSPLVSVKPSKDQLARERREGDCPGQHARANDSLPTMGLVKPLVLHLNSANQHITTCLRTPSRQGHCRRLRDRLLV